MRIYPIHCHQDNQDKYQAKRQADNNNNQKDTNKKKSNNKSSKQK